MIPYNSRPRHVVLCQAMPRPSTEPPHASPMPLPSGWLIHKYGFQVRRRDRGEEGRDGDEAGRRGSRRPTLALSPCIHNSSVRSRVFPIPALIFPHHFFFSFLAVHVHRHGADAEHGLGHEYAAAAHRAAQGGGAAGRGGGGAAWVGIGGGGSRRRRRRRGRARRAEGGVARAAVSGALPYVALRYGSATRL